MKLLPGDKIWVIKSFNGVQDMKTDNFYVYASDHSISIGRAIAIVTVVSEDEKK